MDEEWRDIKDFEGYYQVSNEGRIRSLYRYITRSDNRRRFHKGIVLVLGSNNGGYSVAKLSVNGKLTCRDVHRLVALCFIDNTHDKPWVNHINGIKKYNTLENLELVTKSENAIHALDSKLTPSGEDCPWSKLTNEEVLLIYDLSHKSNMKQTEIATKFNVTKGTVSKIKLGTTGRRITDHVIENIGRGNGRRR